MLEVRLIGSPALAYDDQPLGWPAARRARELLAWLALNPGMHLRGAIAPAFWPDVLDESARASLRTALHELRASLGTRAGAHLRVTRDAIGLADDVQVDVRAIREALAEGRDADAVVLGDGDLLPGLDAEWVREAREDHRIAMDDALARLAGAAERYGDRGAAVRWTRRRVRLDPHAEAPARELMRLLADGGDRAAALAAYDALRERMAADLRVPPSSATRELAQRLREGPSAADAHSAPAAAGRLGERVAAAARRSFVGRRAELARLAGLLTGGDAAVVVISGPGGVGKSRLLAAALDEVRPRLRVVALDCRDVEPTPGGFLRASAAELGSAEREPTPQQVGAMLGGGRTVLALDTYEAFGLMDAWLRREFLPLLPGDVDTVLCGRDDVGSRWRASPGWAALVTGMPVTPLGDEDAARLLGALGVPADRAACVNRFARGHPLALELAATAVVSEPVLDVGGGPPADVIGRLVEAFLAGLDATMVRTVRAAATVRRIDEPLLRALLGVEEAAAAYDGLRRLPFCDVTDDGLLMHDIVRETVARDLAVRDREAALGFRRRAAEVLREAAGRGDRGQMWHATADLLYLVQNPSVRNAFFPPGGAGHSVEAATAGDRAAVRAVAHAWDPPEAVEWIMRWWDADQAAFSVVRGADGDVRGFSVQSELDAVDPAVRASDPVARSWDDDLARRPLGDGGLALVFRRMLTLRDGEALGPAMAALFLDIKRRYMELRPRLTRVYGVVGSPSQHADVLPPLGFAETGPPAAIGDTAFHPIALDFGADSVDGWLARLIDAEVGDPP